MDTRVAGCAHALVYAQFVNECWGKSKEGFSQSMKDICCWRGGLFLTREEIGALSVSSLYFDEGWSVCGCMCVDTHKLLLGCEPRGKDETPGEPEESRWTKSRHICIRC